MKNLAKNAKIDDNRAAQPLNILNYYRYYVVDSLGKSIIIARHEERPLYTLNAHQLNNFEEMKLSFFNALRN